MRAIDLAASLSVRDQITRKVGQFFEKHDLLLSPTLARPLPMGALDLNQANLTGDEVLDRCFEPCPFTPLFNLTGNPAMSVPIHFTPEGMPIGVQFVARAGAEATLLQLAGQLEHACDWGARMPPILTS